MLDSEHENGGPSSQTFSSPNAFAGVYMGSFSVVETDDICNAERTGVSECEMPAYSVGTSFTEAKSNNVTVCGDNLNLSPWKGENDSQIRHAGDDVESVIENVDATFEYYGTVLKDIIGVSRQQENDACTSFEMSFVDADRSTHVATSTDSTICQGSDVPSDFSGYYPSLNCYQGMDARPVVTESSGCLPNGVCPQVWKNEEMSGNMKFAKMEFFADTNNVRCGMHSSTTDQMSFQDSQFMPADSEYPSFFPCNVLFEESESVQNSFHSDYYSELNAGQEAKQLPRIFPTIGCQSYDFFKHEDSDTIVTTDNVNYYQDIIDETANKFPGSMGNLNLKSLDKSLPITRAPITGGKQYNCVTSEIKGELVEHRSIDSQLSKRSTERLNVEDDSDICIIEDISHPAPINRSAELGNSLNTSQSSRCGYTTQPYVVGGTRPKARDEQYILRVALQVGTFTFVGFIMGRPWQLLEYSFDMHIICFVPLFVSIMIPNNFVYC